MLLSTRAALLFACAAICTPKLASTQNIVANKPRELRLAGADGQRSFSLRIWAEGRRGVVIVADEKGRQVQELVCPLLQDVSEPTPEELAAVREQFVAHFLVTDLDFDGHPDLAGIREFGASWARYCVWLYDPKQHVYVKDFLAKQMELLTNLKSLGGNRISSSHIEPASSWVILYRVMGGDGSWPVRQLVPVRSCSAPQGEKPTALVITHFDGGQVIVDKQELGIVNLGSALDKCSSDP
jgi:hypothetical protein